MRESLFEIVENPIDVSSVIRKVQRRRAGAITTFMGVVREWTKGRQTLYLEYQAYIPMALRQMEKIGDEIKRKWPDAKIAITHRIGKLDLSEVAVCIAVSAPHRKEAYEANEYAIRRIKQMVPIWKKEFWTDGEMWIGDQQEKTPYLEGEPIRR